MQCKDFNDEAAAFGEVTFVPCQELQVGEGPARQAAETLQRDFLPSQLKQASRSIGRSSVQLLRSLAGQGRVKLFIQLQALSRSSSIESPTHDELGDTSGTAQICATEVQARQLPNLSVVMSVISTVALVSI